MFELTKQQVKLVDVNPRSEKHGNDRKLACDLKFEASLPNDVLIEFHPELRQVLYKKPEADPDLVEQADPEALSALRFSKIGPLKWNWEAAGYELGVFFGIVDEARVEFEDVKLDGFTFEPQNGGTVNVTWRAVCHPSGEDLGRLCEFIQERLDVTLTSPETLAKAQAQAVIEHAR